MKMVQIVFSPTGGTKKAADLLTKTWGDCTRVDLTDSKADFSAQELTAEDVALIAVPSYGGRVPAPAFQRLTAIHGNGARAILLCVYGNRDYEDTLVELEDLDESFHLVMIWRRDNHNPSIQRLANLWRGERA